MLKKNCYSATHNFSKCAHLPLVILKKQHTLCRKLQPLSSINLAKKQNKPNDMRASASHTPMEAVIEMDSNDQPSALLQTAYLKAIDRHNEAMSAKSALEKEARAVEKLAVEATDAREAAKSRLAAGQAEAKEYERLQAELAERASLVAKRLAELPQGREQGEAGSELESEHSAARARLAELSNTITELARRNDDLCERSAAAEALAARALAAADTAAKAVAAAAREEFMAASAVKAAVALINNGTSSAAAISLPTSAAAPTSDAQSSAAPAAMAQASPLSWALIPCLAIAVAAFLYLPTAAPYRDSLVRVVSPVMSKIAGAFLHSPEYGLLETVILLAASVVCVPAVVKLVPGGSPVLGYLLGGALVGPHATGLIHSVHSVKHIAEMGVVLLLFNIGLELSLARLASMAKLVFGMGTMQVVLTTLGVAGAAMLLTGMCGPSAIILGGALAMSSTAVAVQVLQERGEMGTRFGNAAFSVLLLQDLAVVVLLMLIPLLSPGAANTNIAAALGLAGIKAILAVVAILAGGRLLVRPLYRKIAGISNPEIFGALTLALVLGTSFLTQMAGLSLALGAFLAGLLISETEYAYQVESDISSYKGLLLGLFFMSVGMEISASLFMRKWAHILAAMTVLIVGKLGIIMAAGRAFGLSALVSLRAGLLLAPGGEFAFVAFGEAVHRGVLPAALTNELYVVVALSMAVLPYLAKAGSYVAASMKASSVGGDKGELAPSQAETGGLRNHVVIAGFGRSGELIADLLAEKRVPFVAVDSEVERVATGKDLDLPVYFGDAASPAVLHLVGAEHARCVIITLNTPEANYRVCWAMKKHFPHIKTYVRATDIFQVASLEKAGATAVVPETLEPSLKLAESVLGEMGYPPEEVVNVVDKFRLKHMEKLKELSLNSGTSLGYAHH